MAELHPSKGHLKVSLTTNIRRAVTSKPRCGLRLSLSLIPMWSV